MVKIWFGSLAVLSVCYSRGVIDTSVRGHFRTHAVQQSTCTGGPPQSAATLGISFFLWARLFRLVLIREGQYRERSSWSKPLVKASIEPFDQFVDDLEPASSLNVCWS
jgi:hypothetical protein